MTCISQSRSQCDLERRQGWGRSFHHGSLWARPEQGFLLLPLLHCVLGWGPSCHHPGSPQDQGWAKEEMCCGAGWGTRKAKGKEAGKHSLSSVTKWTRCTKSSGGWNWSGRSTEQSWDRSGHEISVAVTAAALGEQTAPEPSVLLGGGWKAVAFSSHGLVLRWMPASLSASHWNSLGKQVLFLLLASLWKQR